MNELVIVHEQLLPDSYLLNTYFLDLIAVIRTIGSDCNRKSIRDLAWYVIKSIPRQFTTIYLVCDTYCENSIKSGEHASRGQGKRYVIQIPDMKVPSDFDNFLRNGDNKKMLLNLIEQSLIEGRKRLGTRKVYFSNAELCHVIESSQSQVVPELTSDHEEADTKLVALVHAAQITHGQSVLIRSPSGDIDILVLFLMHPCDNIRFLIDNGTGKCRKVIDVSSTGLSLMERHALARMHAFSGNDYVSSFFRKGKQCFWKKVKSNQKFVDLFSKFGLSNEVEEELSEEVEEFVCSIYGFPHLTSVDEVQKEMFVRKFEKEGKTIDLSVLPPCALNLHLHTRRANYVENLYNRANNLIMSLDDPTQHGWDEQCRLIWTQIYFPEDLTELMMEDRDEDDIEYLSSSDDTNSDSENSADDL